MTSGIDRRRFALGSAGLIAAAAALAAPPSAATRRSTRTCCASLFESAETGFDPAQISDLYSRTVTPHIFEAPATATTPGAAGASWCR